MTRYRYVVWAPFRIQTAPSIDHVIEVLRAWTTFKTIRPSYDDCQRLRQHDWTTPLCIDIGRASSAISGPGLYHEILVTVDRIEVQ